MKIGLANIFGLIVLYRYGSKEMFGFNILRVLLASLLKGSLFSVSFFISMTGIILSSAVMIFMYKKATLLFVSLIAAVMHNIGQLTAVMYIYAEVQVFVLGPLLVIIALPCGLLTGFIAKEVLKRLDRYFI